MSEFRITPYQSLVLMLLSRILQRVSAGSKPLSEKAAHYNIALAQVTDAAVYCGEVVGNQRDRVQNAIKHIEALSRRPKPAPPTPSTGESKEK